MPIEILMPALSPTMEEGNVSKWLKKEGDKVAAGDVIAEIETDKATMEVEAVDEGTLARIVVPAGTEGVKVNAHRGARRRWRGRRQGGRGHRRGGDTPAPPKRRRGRQGPRSRRGAERQEGSPQGSGRAEGRNRCRSRRSRPAPRWCRSQSARRCATQWPKRCAATRLSSSWARRSPSIRAPTRSRKACCRSSAPAAWSTRRSPSTASPASASARRWPG